MLIHRYSCFKEIKIKRLFISFSKKKKNCYVPLEDIQNKMKTLKQYNLASNLYELFRDETWDTKFVSTEQTLFLFESFSVSSFTNEKV